jgi:serine/threonine protein kinase
MLVVKDTESVTDLRKEVLRGMALMHTGIVRTHNFEKDEGGAGIIMEYVDGDSLADLKMRQPGYCFEPEQILPWIEQLCSALDYAHREARIVHRDYQAAKLDADQGWQTQDCRLWHGGDHYGFREPPFMEGSISGTLSYMSPQQAEGKRPTILDDIHAVGATIYELLTGKPPFFRGNALSIHNQIITLVPPRMSERREELEVAHRALIPAVWETTIAACLAKDPAVRPQSASELVARLKARTR